MDDKIKLSQTRQALVEEFLKSFPAEGGSNAFWRRTSEQQLVAQFILQALNDYTEEIVRMVERMKVETDPDKLTHDQVNYEMDWREATNKTLSDIKEELQG